MEDVLQLIGAGSDLITIAIGLALYKLDKRVMRLEWGAENEKTRS